MNIEPSARPGRESDELEATRRAAIGRLTGTIAHEFNNLLHVVSMNLELVSMYAKEDKVRQVVDRAKLAAKRGSKLTARLLAFSRNPAGHVAPARVDDVLTGMRELLELAAGSAVEVQLHPGFGGKARLDPAALELDLLVAAYDAREAMPDGGRLTISSTVADGHASVTATDTVSDQPVGQWSFPVAEDEQPPGGDDAAPAATPPQFSAMPQV